MAEEPTDYTKVLQEARQALRHVTVFQAIAKLPEVVSAIERVYGDIPILEADIARLRVQKEAAERTVVQAQAQADETYHVMSERARLADDRTRAAEADAETAEKDSDRRIREANAAADRKIAEAEERARLRDAGLREELQELESQHRARVALLDDQEREARRAVHDAEAQLAALRDSIPVR